MNVDRTPGILSLCSGIGGLDLGVMRAVGGYIVAHVEGEAYAAEVLAQRHEETGLAVPPCWSDIRTFDGSHFVGAVDIVTAGYPCQPFSYAGNRKGEEDERHLWPDVARIIGEVGPPIVFLENVSGHVRLGLDTVLGDLASLGFDAEWSTLRAADVGAPHLRRRVFVLAVQSGVSDAELSVIRVKRERDGEQRGQQRPPLPGDDGANEPLADSHRGRSQGTVSQSPPGWEGPRRRDREGGGFWSTEPDVGRVADGVPSRVDRLRALGNAVVPAQAEHAFRELWRRVVGQL